MNIKEIFGSKTFSEREMKKRLPEETFDSLHKTIQQGLRLDISLATVVAEAMKDWALEQGATHYSHWFQPMNNVTAGKHDSFIELKSDGSVELEFGHKALIIGESDASSFPSGGLRETFEARGYTAWDPTSSAFVIGTTLYIPTIFCSFTGESLDTKTPLLRSQEVLSKQGMRLLKVMGNTTSTSIRASVGAEQEYFLLDREMASKRLDLKICGRTLFGAKPPKGQELEDQYCGKLRQRVIKYMEEVDENLWELGVASKTRHNEAAPAQHELAPIYTDVNTACDHNHLIMMTMKAVAKKHELTCLFHEKPFEGVNGSGKHNNYSLTTDDGINILRPGSNPAQNKVFLIALCAFIKAVDNYGDLLRMSASCAGNEYRLGALEAPPAIISIFLGGPLTNILFQYSSGNRSDIDKKYLETGVKALPSVRKDDEDRNRTSPFAFTGNKFEFRMVGSSQSIANANMVLNVSVAESFEIFANRLEDTEDVESEIDTIISETVANHSRIIFNGNNYSAEWAQEARQRGLPVLNSSIDGYKAFINPKNMDLFDKYGIFTNKECMARYEINVENYIKTITIEAATMLEMTKRQILPSCIEYAGRVAESYNQMCKANINSLGIKSHVEKTAQIIEDVIVATEVLDNSLSYSQRIGDLDQRGEFMYKNVRHDMKILRRYCDTLEAIIDSKNWAMPTYTDLLFSI